MKENEKHEEQPQAFVEEPATASQPLTQYQCVHLKPGGMVCGCPSPPPGPQWVCPACGHAGVEHQPI